MKMIDAQTAPKTFQKFQHVNIIKVVIICVGKTKKEEVYRFTMKKLFILEQIYKAILVTIRVHIIEIIPSGNRVYYQVEQNKAKFIFRNDRI